MSHHMDCSLPLQLVLTTGNVPSMKTQRLTVGEVQTMKTHCEAHPEVELRVIVYCPACRGQHGGTEAAKAMTAAEKTKRAKKAARARWKKAKAKK
jgi:hypothetical protein